MVLFRFLYSQKNSILDISLSSKYVSVSMEKQIVHRVERDRKNFASMFNGVRISKYNTHFDGNSKMQNTIPNEEVLKNSPIQLYPSPTEKRVVWKSLVLFYYSLKYVKQRITFKQTTKKIAQAFSRGCRRLIRTYLYKLVEVISRVSIQCNMAEVLSNRIP